MDGEVIKLYIYDLGTSLQPELIRSVYKNQEDFSKIEYNTPTPEEIPQFTLPVVFNLRSSELQLGNTKIPVRVQVAIYELGTLSIRIRFVLDHASEELLTMLAFGKDAEIFSKQLAEKTKTKAESEISKQVHIEENELMEMYNFYFINDTKERTLKSKNLIAGLLVNEPEAGKMDEDYIKDILSRSISYYNDDAFFVGWEGAVLVDLLKSIDYEMLMAEIANIQLLKLRIYKQKTSSMLQATSKSVEELDKQGFFERIISSKAVSLNAKLNLFSDNLNEMLNKIDNTVFGLGEWYLSRIYALFVSVFKLDELRRSVEQDASKISARKSIINEKIVAKRNDTLELIVILLIVLEIVVETAYLLK
ncbi:MAG: hypothetical protein ACP5T4_00725 [Candidatus Micrarchaeia archaeon]